MGYGLLPIDNQLLAALFDAATPFNLEKAAYDEVHKALDLPEDMSVKWVGYDAYRGCILVSLESERFPEVEPGMMYPQVAPLLTIDNFRLRHHGWWINDKPEGSASSRYWTDYDQAELAQWREIGHDLVEQQPSDREFGDCVFCSVDVKDEDTQHESDCLITKARALVKAKRG